MLIAPVVGAVITLVFLLIHLVPGDPVLNYLGEGATPQQVTDMRRRFGLDQSLPAQYANYWKQVVQGDLGTSFLDRKPVSEKIRRRYPATLQLAIGALLIALLMAIPLGVTAGIHPDAWQDHSASFLALLGISVPNFALGPMAILVFSVLLRWLPASGYGSPAHLVLPAVTLGAALAAILTRMIRSGVIEEMNRDYVRTARAKGLPEQKVVYTHVLKNGLIPVVTMVGLQFGVLLGGAIITERIFNWPGLGSLTIEAISTRDYPLVQGCILVIALTYILVNAMTDLLYRLLDPRIEFA
ncbi:MAG: ABC transporter permease [Acidobacteria bacterium]|nr:ABC transporter permease [Acidobacteriota bacterium]